MVNRIEKLTGLDLGNPRDLALIWLAETSDGAR